MRPKPVLNVATGFILLLIKLASVSRNESLIQMIQQRKPRSLFVMIGNVETLIAHSLRCILNNALHLPIHVSDSIASSSTDTTDESPGVEEILFVVKGSIGSCSRDVKVELTAAQAMKFMNDNKHRQSHFIVQRFIPELCNAEYRFYVKWNDMRHAPHMLVKTGVKIKNHRINAHDMDVHHIPLHRTNLYQPDEDLLVMDQAPSFINAIVNKLRGSILFFDVTPIIRFDIFFYEGDLYLNEIEVDFDMTFFSSSHHDELIKDYGIISFYYMCRYWSYCYHAVETMYPDLKAKRAIEEDTSFDHVVEDMFPELIASKRAVDEDGEDADSEVKVVERKYNDSDEDDDKYAAASHT